MTSRGANLSLAKRTVFSVLSLVIALAAVEAGLRLSGLILLWRRHDLPSSSPHPGELRILCAGDSYTYGVGAPPESSYPAQLERALDLLLPDQDHRCVNAGIPDTNFEEALAQIDQLVPTVRPKVVLLLTGANEPYRPSNLERVRESSPPGFSSELRLVKLVKLFFRTRKELRKDQPHAANETSDHLRNATDVAVQAHSLLKRAEKLRRPEVPSPNRDAIDIARLLEFPPITDSRQAQVQANIAKTWLALGENDKAREHSLRAQTLAPNWIVPLHMLAEIAIQQDRPEEALRYAGQLREKYPSSPWADLLWAEASLLEAAPGAENSTPFQVDPAKIGEALLAIGVRNPGLLPRVLWDLRSLASRRAGLASPTTSSGDGGASRQSPEASRQTIQRLAEMLRDKHAQRVPPGIQALLEDLAITTEDVAGEPRFLELFPWETGDAAAKLESLRALMRRQATDPATVSEKKLAIAFFEAEKALSPSAEGCRLLANEAFQLDQRHARQQLAARATELDPEDPLSWNALAYASYSNGDNAQSRSAALDAYRIDPTLPGVLKVLVRALAPVPRPAGQAGVPAGGPKNQAASAGEPPTKDPDLEILLDVAAQLPDMDPLAPDELFSVLSILKEKFAVAGPEAEKTLDETARRLGLRPREESGEGASLQTGFQSRARALLREAKEICRPYGCRLLLLDYPLSSELNAWLRQAASEEKVDLVPVSEFFQALRSSGPVAELYSPDGHLTAEGYRKMADFVAQRILPFLRKQ